MTVRALLRCAGRWMFGTPLSILDVLARTAERAERADAKARHPATQPVPGAPLFACPHCGETMCCALMAEQLTDTEWENGQ